MIPYVGANFKDIERAKAENEAIDRAFREVFGQASAPAVLKDLAGFCDIFASYQNASEASLREVAGKRAVFLYIIERLGYDEAAMADLISKPFSKEAENGG